jgi:hypothetical protein
MSKETDEYLRHQMPGWAGEEPWEPAVSQTKCEHMRFLSEAKVTRLTDKDGLITGYTVDIRIKCDDCGLPFRFLGLAAGSHYAEPRTSVDATELRAPLEPAYVTEILGHPLQSGKA